MIILLNIDLTNILSTTESIKNIVNNNTQGGTNTVTNVVVYGKDSNKIYKVLNDIISEIPGSDRCILFDNEKMIKLTTENFLTLENIREAFPEKDAVVKCLELMPDRVIIGILNDSLGVSLLLRFMLVGYSSILFGLVIRDNQNIAEVLSLQHEIQNIPPKDGLDELSSFIMGNINIGIRV